MMCGEGMLGLCIGMLGIAHNGDKVLAYEPPFHPFNVKLEPL